MATTTTKVLDAISSVMGEIGTEGISKARKNVQQGYNFRGIDDVYNALSPILAKHKLVIMPDVLEREVTERQTKQGGTLFYVTVRVKWTLASAEDASSIEAVTYGEAMDSGDKATNKAMSAAFKYMAMMTFCIPTEGDNDADGTTHEVVPHTASKATPNGVKRLSSTQAKERGLDTKIKDQIECCLTHEELAAWDQDFDKHTAECPASWLDAIRNNVIFQGEEISKVLLNKPMDDEYRARMA